MLILGTNYSFIFNCLTALTASTAQTPISFAAAGAVLPALSAPILFAFIVAALAAAVLLACLLPEQSRHKTNQYTHFHRRRYQSDLDVDNFHANHRHGHSWQQYRP